MLALKRNALLGRYFKHDSLLRRTLTDPILRAEIPHAMYRVSFGIYEEHVLRKVGNGMSGRDGRISYAFYRIGHHYRRSPGHLSIKCYVWESQAASEYLKSGLRLFSR